MRVRFSPEILSEDQCFRILDRIVDFFIDGRHCWEVEDFDEIVNSPWMASDSDGRAGKVNFEVLNKCFTRAAYNPNGTHDILITVTITPNGALELTPSDAKRALEGPLYVFVENSESDGSFWDAMIHCLRRKLLQEAQSEAWWQYEHLGGYGEIEKRVNEVLARTYGPKRLFIIADSDSEFPGHISATAKKVTETCQKIGVPFSILSKRKIENYLPLTLLSYSDKQQTFAAFSQMSQVQRDHYEMKKGFRTGQNGEVLIPNSQRSLYTGLDSILCKGLCGGFGKNIYSLFKSKRELLRQVDLEEICPNNPMEINSILDEIEKLL